MIRETKFLISRRPYAVDLDSLRVQETHTRQDGSPYYVARIDAVWYRRKQGVTTAHIGTLWDFQDGEPTSDPAEFLARHDDGRYGGDCDGRWDGEGYWGAQRPETIDAHLAILRPMLANFPAIPDGYEGWFSFATGAR